MQSRKEGLAAMVRMPGCEEQIGLKKGPWTPEEDQKLMSYVEAHGHSCWRALPKQAGLARCGKSCRLRWTNYLRPGIKRGNFAAEEEESIIHLHALLGNRWSMIATHLPGRTDNEIKNHWNTRLRKRLVKMGIDPMTHMPYPMPPPATSTTPSINNLLLSLLNRPSLPNTITTTDPLTLLKSHLFNASSTSCGPPSTHTCSSSLSHLPMIDSTILASIETRLILDCLKLGSSDGNRSSSDNELNGLVTRLLLVKLLQQRSSNGTPATLCSPTFDSKGVVGADPHTCNLSCANPLLYQGLHSMLGATSVTKDVTKTPMAPAAPHMNPQFPKCDSNGASHNALSVSALLSSSPYQQRLLHALPFLADAIEPCGMSNAADDISSNQLRPTQARQLNSSPSSCSNLPPPLWSTVGADNHTTTPSGPLLGGMPTNFMAWEELLMREPDRDIGSSSTVNNTSSSNTLSSSSVHATASPSTPTTNVNAINAHDYWSSLLNLISPNISTHHTN